MVPFDSSTFVRISIKEVVLTLIEAFVLVFLVILLFLQNLRATIVPMLVVPVAILGAFGGMYFVGFSINVLSLFGLVLAIGIVVDDAIVVVENVERIMAQEGLSAKEATRKSMQQITGAIVAVSVVLAAVFIPELDDDRQRRRHLPAVRAHYRHLDVPVGHDGVEFHAGVVRHIAAPAARRTQRSAARASTGCSTAQRTATSRALLPACGTRRAGWWCMAPCFLACVFLFQPPADELSSRGGSGLCARHRAAAGGRHDRAHASRAGAHVRDHARRTRSSSGRSRSSGFSFLGQGENVGMAFMRLKPWDEREADRGRVHRLGEQGASARIKEAQIFVVNLPTIRGLGQFSGFDFRLQDRAGLGPEQLTAARQTLLAKASQNPALAGVRFNGLADAPQLRARSGSRAGAGDGPFGVGRLHGAAADAGAGVRQRFQLRRARAARAAAGGRAVSACAPRI